MAGSARYTAVLDANVLYGALVRDLLLSLAHADLFSAKWTVDIRREWTCSLLKNKPEMGPQIELAANTMERAIPDCLVTGYEHLIEGLTLPDVKDRHVLAAAITGHADAIVTFNVKDFPHDALDPFGIEIQTPDEFVLNQIMLKGTVALTAIKVMRQRLGRPELTAQDLVDLLALRQMPQTAAHLQDVVQLI
jgi:predicted nucleic acid-binding protein